VYNNGYHGIICSRFCDNIEIIDNKIYNNIGHGIMLDRNVTNSIVSNNTIINNDSGVMLFSSNNNTISNNIISDNKHGIRVSYGSSYNTISNNIINNSRTYGIYLLKNTYENVIRDNIIINADDSAIYIDDAERSSNYIMNNIIKSVTHYNIRLRDANAIMLNNKYACNDICIYLDKNNSILHINDNLYNITYRSKGNNHIKIIDENNYVYSNSLKIPQIITSNSSILEFNIEHYTLTVNREDVSIIASNPISVIYDDVIYINADTLTDIKINGKQYYLTDYVKFDDGIYTINGNVILYDSCNIDMSKIGIDKYIEFCSIDYLIKQIPNYLYSINTVIFILISFSILSFILIVKKR
jgi:parallel beta-helix repeat protein